MSRNAAKSPPKAAPKGSSTPSPKRPPKMDRRVRSTRDALGDALVELMHEKAFAEITVQHVLDRAGVSRSTFYTHYRDKDDLFLSDVEDFLEAMAFSLSRRGEASKRVAPVRELFSHVAEWRQFHTVLVAAGKIRDFLEMAQGYFARAIEQRLCELEGTHALPTPQRAAEAEMLAGALVSLMSQWISSGAPASPSEMDDLFHHMVWSGVSGRNLSGK